MHKRNITFAALISLPFATQAATIALKPGDNLAVRLNSARSGDVVQFAAGTFTTNSLTVPSGVTLRGSDDFASHLVFRPTAQNPYGIVVPANASNVTITGLDLVSSNGVLGMYQGNGYSHVHFTNNHMQFGGGTTANNTAVFGIYGSIGCDDLQITDNFFHDSPSSVRTWEVWGDQNSNLDHNRYDNVTDGGHLMEPRDNCSFSFNSGKRLRRMAQEIQGNTPSSGLRVVGNVFSDWVSPYYDSFGLSVVNDKSNGTLIEGNDLRATIAAGSTWGIADGGGAHRFGYGIEAGGNGIVVQNNILVGDWTAGVCASTPAVVRNNHKFGPPNWGDWSTEAAGKITASDNTVDRNIANAPALAAVPTTQAAASNSPAVNSFRLTATPVDSRTAVLTWLNAPPEKLVVNAISTVGHETGATVGPIGRAVDTSPMTIGGLHPGWQIDLQLAGDSGSRSTVATIQMPAAPTIQGPQTIVQISRIDTILYYSDGSTRTVTTRP